jgi:hypothetical protein
MIIAMWSGPRNLSTAMMRSFGARPDCGVMDEPFFAPFLHVSGKDHPGRAETLARHDVDPEKVAAQCVAPSPRPYSFQKHMPHHMLAGFPLDWAAKATSFFLIRHPQRVIASYAKGRAEFDLDDLGFAPQRHLWEKLGRPPVIHSETILQNPEAALTTLCAAIGIPFDLTMLSWDAGPRDEDGAWAPYWYENVQRSTGFGAAPENMPEIAPNYQAMLDACLPDYEVLAADSLKV